eukprot:m.3266 g.3266  ORF g.3266 m.3266 type:complete len:263 (+) comp2722_c0_seq1:83-871(+)
MDKPIQMSTSHHCKRMQGKVAIVTASTLGIGKAIAIRLAQEGAKVVLSSRKENNVSATEKELRDLGLEVTGIVCHVGNEGDRSKLVTETLNRYGKIDYLVSNAAVQPSMGLTLETPETAYDKIFDINLKSHWQLVAACRDHMNYGGAVVFISSTGAYSPTAPLGLYGVSKTAMLGLSKAVARELGPKNIRVNCVAPGLVRTKFSKALWSGGNADSLIQQTFLGRVGDPVDISGVVAFLLSDDASWISGETIVVNGGSGASRL